jgi:hypothetical protein
MGDISGLVVIHLSRIKAFLEGVGEGGAQNYEGRFPCGKTS